jgi:protein-tyrosine-phosphatase
MERGIETPGRSSKGLDAIPTQDIHLIVGLGDVEAPAGAFAFATRWEHWPVSDPRAEAGEALNPFYRAIDEIDRRVAALFLDYWRNLA